MKKLNAPYVIVTSETIKENREKTVEAIQRKLGAGCKPTHALDIASASVGINDYQTFKGLNDKDHYVLKANMGAYDKPFYVEKNVGFFDNHSLALLEAETILKVCNKLIEWELWKNGEQTHSAIKSKPTIDGLYTSIELFGDTMRDIELALEDVTNDITVTGYTSGHGNGQSEYQFEIHGEESEPNFFAFEDTPNTVIVDDTGFLLKNGKSKGSLEGHFFRAGEMSSRIPEWEGDLLLLKSVDIENVDDDDSLYALDSDGFIVHNATPEEIKQMQKERDAEKVYLFLQAEIKR